MANNTIKEGTFIEGKHVAMRKMLSEPQQCLRCQRFGHHVPDCKADKDTCAQCGEHHCTSQCNTTDQALFNCVNCTGDTVKGHSAADRNCPKFAMEKHKIMEWIPENKFKFFPMDDPATWRLLNNPGPWEEQQKQTPPPCNTAREPPNTDIRHQQQFMEDWQTIHTPLKDNDKKVPAGRHHEKTDTAST
jgi:hypothetical protein